MEDNKKVRHYHCPQCYLGYEEKDIEEKFDNPEQIDCDTAHEPQFMCYNCRTVIFILNSLDGYILEKE